MQDGDDLHGYTQEEIKLIALLMRYHRKKIPKKDVPEGSSKEVKQKFRIFCTIMRVSCAVQQCLPVNFQFKEFIDFSEGFKLVRLVFIEIRFPWNKFEYLILRSVSHGTHRDFATD
ncbi:hypothetical protein ACS0TY_006191 [Phlomoides rotata]